jgi:hypothetical protein
MDEPVHKGAFRQHWIVFCFVLLLTVPDIESLAPRVQNQALALSQIERLIRIQTPDQIVAQEIRKRGLDFVPSTAILQRLRGLGAGPETQQAVELLVPMLDEAKRVIPELIGKVYQALNEGNPSAVRQAVSPQLASDTSKLDFICKPFTYRAHYIEAIVERPNRLFEARVRALFQPLDERAYVLVFGLSQGSFYLTDVRRPPDDWFGPQLSAAAEIARKFVYAFHAGREETVLHLVSPSLARSNPMQAKAFQQLRTDSIIRVNDSGSAKMVSYKGLKAYVGLSVCLSEAVVCPVYQFDLDFFDKELKIVWWEAQWVRTGLGNNAVEDPQLEDHTLARFGLQPRPVTATATTQQDQRGAQSSDPTAVTTIPLAFSALCGTYEACLQSAKTDVQSRRFDAALPKLQEASRLEPAKGEPYLWIASVHFFAGRYQEVWPLADKALKLGEPSRVQVCRQRVAAQCEVGTLSLSAERISLVDSKGSTVFEASPSAVTSQGAQIFGFTKSAYLPLKVYGKNYKLFYVPPFVRCRGAVGRGASGGFGGSRRTAGQDVAYECPEPGFTQQKVWANYVHDFLRRISSGQF